MAVWVAVDTLFAQEEPAPRSPYTEAIVTFVTCGWRGCETRVMEEDLALHRKEHGFCINGHRMTASNVAQTYRHETVCVTCRREQKRQWDAKRPSRPRSLNK